MRLYQQHHFLQIFDIQYDIMNPKIRFRGKLSEKNVKNRLNLAL